MSNEDHVLASIKLQGQEHLGGPYRCGCEQRGKHRWYLCSYHEGFGDGYDAALEAAFDAALGGAVNEQGAKP